MSSAGCAPSGGQALKFDRGNTVMSSVLQIILLKPTQMIDLPEALQQEWSPRGYLRGYQGTTNHNLEAAGKGLLGNEQVVVFQRIAAAGVSPESVPLCCASR